MLRPKILPSWPQISLASITTGLIGYTSIVLYRQAPIRRFELEIDKTCSQSFLRSRTIKSIINPNSHIPSSDSCVVSVRLLRGLSNEQILIAFARGFFGGYVFAPESLVLRVLGLRIYPSRHNFVLQSEIWRQKELTKTSSLEVGTLLFGVFLIVDKNIREECEKDGQGIEPPQVSVQHERIQQCSESYIDFAFGSDSSSMRGVHRLSIISSRDVDTDGHEDKVRLCCYSMCVNPRENKPFGSSLSIWFHETYKLLLFKDAVAEVLRLDAN